MDCNAADPPGIFRCQEGDEATDIVRLRQTLERLHAPAQGRVRRPIPESVLITWVPDDWTLTPGAVFAVAESAKFPS
jgi:hypothetical protein